MQMIGLTAGVRWRYFGCWLSSALMSLFQGLRNVSLCGYPALWPAIGVVAILVTVSSNAMASFDQQGVTVDDLAMRVRIRPINVSPDGNQVAFLAVKGIPLRDRYEVTLYLRTTADTAEPETLARYLLTPHETFNDSWELVKTVSQFVWSQDSQHLLYTVHAGREMELRVRTLGSRADNLVLSEHERIEINEATGNGRGWKIKTFDASTEATETNHQPRDPALLMRDGYNFIACCVDNPKTHLPTAIESWEYDWGAAQAREYPGTRVVQLLGYPDEFVWDGNWVELKKDLEDAERTRAIETEKFQENAVELLVELGSEKTTVSVKRGNYVKKIYEENGGLAEDCEEEPNQRTDTCVSKDGRLSVLFRSTNLSPEELVKLDLTKGRVTSLFSPNASLGEKARGVRVRFMPLPFEVGSIPIHGRLYLPPDDGNHKRYPLVFAPYRSTPHFFAGSGDEVPILSLVAHGIGVFALDAWGFCGHKGDFGNAVKCVEEPREAMEWVIRKLAEEGLVDPERCGVTGLSYGSQIAMYSYWKSRVFRAVSAAGGSDAPTQYPLSGPIGFESWKDRGFPEPSDRSYAIWKNVSAGLNARPTLPPLLLQTPDGERMANIETWTRLRGAGAQVEWLEYPDEGHLKVGPANKWWVNQRNLDWFRFWLKDQEDPDQVKVEQYRHWREMRKNWEAAKTAEKGRQK
jgi:dipeptidyl aminopeptidase/acylaminoacyl peptidase